MLVTQGYGIGSTVEESTSGGGSSGGMGGSIVTHTEYRDKPLPIVRVSKIDDETFEDKEIRVINVKDFNKI